MAETTNDILTAKEAAELLRVDVDKLRSLSACGKIPGWKIGGSWRYSRRALLARAAVEPSPAPVATRVVRQAPAAPVSAFVPPKQNRYAGQF